MPKLPLVGGPYPSRSLAAAASELTNLYAEIVENAADQSKNTANLFGCPGKHSFLEIDFGVATEVRGLWSGGGRLFVALGKDIVEVDSTRHVVVGSRHTYTTVDDATPVQIFGNARQLLVISGGQAYVDNGDGLGPLPCRFQLNGTVTVAGTTATWKSGNQFTDAMVGKEMTINGHPIVVLGATATVATLASGLGGGSGIGVIAFGGPSLYSVSGDVFTDALIGNPITIGTIPDSISNASPAIISRPGHGMELGTQSVTFSGATGVTPGWLDLNATFLATVIDENTFSVPLNTTGFGALTGTVVFNAVDYVVKTVSSPRTLELKLPAGVVVVFGWKVFGPLGGLGQVAYSSIQADAVYSAPGGDLVTAVTGGYMDSTFYVQRPAQAPIVYHDLVVGTPNTDVSSAAFPFTTASVGERIVITGAVFGDGTYTVISVTPAHVATLSASLGAAGFPGGDVTGYMPDLGRQITFSDVGDGSFWRGSDFFSKEGAADYIRSILIDAEVLYAFGTETSEAFQNNPSSGLPQRISGAMQKYGSISQWGPAAIGGKVYFVGGNAQGGPVAYRIDNSIPTRISTHAIESYWKKKGFGPGCISYSYLEEGHTFWVINFGRIGGDGSLAEAWAWDETTKLWHRRMKWTGTAFAGYETYFHTYISEWGDGAHITAGDMTTSVIYVSDVNFYDDDGNDTAWRRAIPYRYNAGNRIYFGRMQLEMETGTVASGAAPLITRDYSDDRGKTFVNPQTVSAGVHDDNSILLYWLRGGCSRGRTWRFFGSGQYKVALIDLECDEVLGTT